MTFESAPSSVCSSDSSSRRVLVLTASVGAGHNQAARAIQETLLRADPSVQVDCWDVLDYTPWLFRVKYARGYALAVSRLPRLYGLGFALTDRPRGPGRTLLERRRLGSERRALERLGEAVEAYRPDLVVHTHFLAPPYLHRLGERRGRALRQFIVTTDVLPHRWWYCEGAERYFTAHDAGRDRLIERGAPAERITVSGMPVHPKWAAALPSREILCANWSLPSDRRIVLLGGGADFTCGPIVNIARAICRARRDACVVVLGGRNKKLLGRLAQLPETREGRIVPQGFTDRLAELAELADVMVTKAGGLTTAECLVKHLPMIFLRPVPGQEKDNAEFFAGLGAGSIARSVRDVAGRVEELLSSADKRQAMRDASARLCRDGGKIISEAIFQALG